MAVHTEVGDHNKIFKQTKALLNCLIILIEENKIAEIKMEDPETLTDCIDYNILGSKKKKKLRLNPTSFIAGYLQLLIRSNDYKEASQAIKERVRHLSFLVHLFCRYDDFDAVFHEYKIVQVSKTHLGIT